MAKETSAWAPGTEETEDWNLDADLPPMERVSEWIRVGEMDRALAALVDGALALENCSMGPIDAEDGCIQETVAGLLVSNCLSGPQIARLESALSFFEFCANPPDTSSSERVCISPPQGFFIAAVAKRPATEQAAYVALREGCHQASTLDLTGEKARPGVLFSLACGPEEVPARFLVERLRILMGKERATGRRRSSWLPSLWYAFLASPFNRVRLAAVESEDAPLDMLRLAIAHPFSVVRSIACLNSSAVPLHWVDPLVKDPSAQVRAAVAYRTKSPNVAAALAGDADPTVRRTIVCNPALALPLATALLVDADASVAAAGLRRATGCGGAGVRRSCAIALLAHPAAPEVLTAVACCPAAGLDLLAMIADYVTLAQTNVVFQRESARVLAGVMAAASAHERLEAETLRRAVAVRGVGARSPHLLAILEQTGGVPAGVLPGLARQG